MGLFRSMPMSQFKKGIKVETNEHPTLKFKHVKQLVKDHLNEDKNYYGWITMGLKRSMPMKRKKKIIYVSTTGLSKEEKKKVKKLVNQIKRI